MKVQIVRSDSTDQGTTGVLYTPKFVCKTMELPWKDNRKNVSCIPTGIYKVEPYKSARFGFCFKVMDVPDRTDILIHSGNWAGDILKGYKSDSSGCILLGATITTLANQLAVTSSSTTLRNFIHSVDYEEFQLEIYEQREI